MRADELVRFMEKVSPEPTSGCWLWTGSTMPNGYGGVFLDGKNIGAHRASFIHFKGPIPDGLIVCHSCDVRGCVNPSHLWLGTHKQNAEDRDQKGRYRIGGRHDITKDIADAIKAEYRGPSRYQGRGKRSQNSTAAIAERHGVSRCTVSYIVRGLHWTEGPCPP